jgi:hypothetical protein
VRITIHRSLPSHRPAGFACSLALQLITLVILLSLPSVEPRPISSPSTIAVAYVPPPGASANDRLTPPVVRKHDDVFSEQEAVGGPLDDVGPDLPELAFNLERVRERRNDLFPFLTWDLVFLDELQRKVRAEETKLQNPLGHTRRRSSRPPLVLSSAQMQQTIDATWSRRERWRNFKPIVDLIDTYNPDDGRLPALMHAYLDQNLLQPYFDASHRDPRYWTMLGLASDHASIVEFVGGFVRDHPSTRTTTELLFMLDEFAQASRDSLLMLLSTDPEIQLQRTHEVSREAFNLAVSIRQNYERWLAAHDLDRPEDLRRRFDGIRLSVLSLIVATTPEGYGAADARFLAGRILWEQNDLAGARRQWQQMTPDERGSYREAVEATLAARQEDGSFNAVEIQRILGAEYRRWITDQERRLQQFGFMLDTF